MSPNCTTETFSSKEALYTYMQVHVLKIILEAIAQRGRAFIALSGGNTPRPFLKRLSQTDIPWEKVTVTLVDERWVETDSPDSNEHLIQDALMTSKAGKAHFIGLMSDAKDPYEGIEICRSRLKGIADDFDLVILGMGEDGHTASLFPQAKELALALSTEESCLVLTPPSAPYTRITLSLSRLLRSRHIFLHIEGKKKFKVLQKAMNKENIEEMPIRAFIYREDTPPLEVYYAQ